MGDAQIRGQIDVAVIGAEFAADCREQARFAGAVGAVMPALLPRKTVKLTRSNSGSGPRRRVRSRADNTRVYYEDRRIGRNPEAAHSDPWCAAPLA